MSIVDPLETLQLDDLTHKLEFYLYGIRTGIKLHPFFSSDATDVWSTHFRVTGNASSTGLRPLLGRPTDSAAESLNICLILCGIY